MTCKDLRKKYNEALSICKEANDRVIKFTKQVEKSRGNLILKNAGAEPHITHNQ